MPVKSPVDEGVIPIRQATEEGIEGDPERQIRLYLLPLSGRGWPRQGEP